ncbi:aldose 1-epimerase [Pseudoduganella violaceinigra]|uniref:aldose 1-epimerase n=1 Tax=Pseudoduganella violaceinigra TaxID=246602 RepID=UPI0004210AE9|nr:aldose 1-epimerase [Pseudoduganella violaceinigra]
MRTRLLPLQYGSLRAELAPGIGGSLARFYSEQGRGQRFHWLRPASEGALRARDARAMASFPLLPFCNRLRGGRAEYGGRKIALAPHPSTVPHALHGVGWQLPWHSEIGGAADARMTLRYEGQARGGWPWPFEAVQDIRLDEQGMLLELSIRNLGDDPMPVGLGHHPYLPRRHGTRLQARLEGKWATDAACLPTALEQPPLLEQLAAGRKLQGLRLDHNFCGWQGVARIDWPAGERRRAAALTLRAAAPLDLLALYVPPNARWFCVEPVSNCTDWLNLAGYPPAATGGAVLAPGAALHSALRLEAHIG